MKKISSFLNRTTSFGETRPMLTRFFRYFLSASSFSGLDFVMLIIFVDFFKIFYLNAAGISFVIATTLHYFVARRWGFKGTDRAHGEGYITFIVLGVISLGLTIFFMELLVNDLDWHYLLAKLLVVTILGVINFFSHYYLTFRIHLNKKN